MISEKIYEKRVKTEFIIKKSIDFLRNIWYTLCIKKSKEKKMISRGVTIRNSVGLHARPATFFVQKANSFKSSIWVEKEDCRVNAKSLLGVLSLGISKGTAITLIADGIDENSAVEGLAELIDSEFGEK